MVFLCFRFQLTDISEVGPLLSNSILDSCERTAFQNTHSSRNTPRSKLGFDDWVDDSVCSRCKSSKSMRYIVDQKRSAFFEIPVQFCSSFVYLLRLRRKSCSEAQTDRDSGWCVHFNLVENKSKCTQIVLANSSELSS